MFKLKYCIVVGVVEVVVLGVDNVVEVVYAVVVIEVVVVI
jgi:hypothetical protein